MDNKLYVAITIKKSEIVDSISTNVDNASNSDNYTVSQLIELINPNASSFLKYFPNQMLSSDQLIGKRKGIEYDIENYDPELLHYEMPTDEYIENKKKEEGSKFSTPTEDDVIRYSMDNDIYDPLLDGDISDEAKLNDTPFLAGHSRRTQLPLSSRIFDDIGG